MKIVTMKKVVLLFFLLCSLTSTVRALDFTSGGQNYSFSTVSGFSPNQTLLMSQPWWGNPTLLNRFVTDLNYLAPNNTYFAYGYGVDPNWFGGAYVEELSNSYCCGPNGGAINIIGANLSLFGFVTLLAPPGPSAADTQLSLKTSALKLRSVFDLAAASSNFSNMNTYECDLFDDKGMCVALGGRETSTNDPDAENTSAVLVLGYRFSPTVRIGGFLDKSVNNDSPDGIQLSNKNPFMGLFVVWNRQADGMGFQIKIANAYQSRGVTTTRDVFGTSEPGKGNTDLTTQSYVGELSYAFNYKRNTLLRPYLALRYTAIKQDAYTESGVSTPLSYAALTDRSTTALLGVKLQQTLAQKVTLTASLGVEQDLDHRVDRYAATGISGLTSENFNDDIQRTRPVGSLGLMYALTKTQRLSAEVLYQELPFQSTASTTVYLTYTIGL
ncbi:MAG: autotransporter outer membrane beta-barrel domain-containing protein [Betaproteobacteria bacterium]